jgi:hypothetical protein
MSNNKEAANYSLADKWGKALDSGFVVIPSALLRYQYKLGINDGEVVVLMNLLMSWWKVNEFPFPQTSTLATRMNVTTRTVQRHLESLEKKRLVTRIWATERREDRRNVARYDLSGIVAELKRLAAAGHHASPTGAVQQGEQGEQGRLAVKPNYDILLAGG